MILPLRVFGSSSVKTTVFGRAIGPIFSATWARSSWPRSSVGGTGIGPQGHEGHDGLSRWWHRCAPTTADSATAGWSTRADSTSVVEMRWPETFMTSSTRPSSQR